MSEQDLECASCGVPRMLDRTVVKHVREVLDGKWLIEGQLGKGGMGVVFLATDIALDRKVAIKALAPSLCQDTEVVARFEREAKMMAKLEHPNLVPIYAVGKKEGVPFLVMKYLEGQNLGDHLREKGKLDLDEVVAIMRQTCAGLGFVHEQGFIHRDIKPANLFLSPEGRVTLLDLGVAHDPKSMMTRSGLLIGTPRYMSPEQILGVKVDRRADLYALGTVLYEMVTGVAVFDGESDFSVMRAHTDLPPPDPSKFADMSREVADVIQTALAKKPEERFQTAGELFDALEAAVAGQRNKSKGPRPAATKLAPLSVSVPSTVMLREQKATPSPKRRAPVREVPSTQQLVVEVQRSSSRWPLLLGLGGLLAAGGVAWLFFRPGEEQPKPMEAPPRVERPVKPPPSLPPPEPVPEVKPPPDVIVAAPPVEPPPPVKPPPEEKDPQEPREKTDRPGSIRRPKSDSATKVSIKARPAELRVVVLQDDGPSWAWLDVDGIRKGTTPKTLQLEPGEHTIRLERPGFQTITRVVSLKAGENRTLKESLEQ
ncbi:MAG: protein kinase domain-containing protein [Myxococcota bacterium]